MSGNETSQFAVDVYIYDAVRTPRGKGKNTGSLHEITSLQLATQALKALKRLVEGGDVKVVRFRQGRIAYRRSGPQEAK